VYSTASNLKTTIAPKWWAHHNPVRIRWIRSIRRVIRQRLVAETTQVLARLESQKEKRGRRVSVRKAKEI